MARTIHDLPSPKGDFITGNLKQFSTDNRHQVMEDWAKEAGDLFSIRLLVKKFIVSTDPDFNLEILKQRPDVFRRFFKIAEIMEEMGVIGVFNAEGDVWKKHRKLTSEALSRKNVQGFFPILEEVTLRLLNKWEGMMKAGKQIDVHPELMRYTVDITSSVAFGVPTNTLEKEGSVIQDHLEKLFPMLNHRMTAPIPIWRVFKSKKDKELDHALIEIKKHVQGYIDEGRKRLAQNPALREQPSNFLEALLVEQEKEGGFSDKEVFGNIFTILLAGEDTTSNSISWAIFYLAQHPEIVREVRKEAFTVYGNDRLPASSDVIAKLKFTEAVALESMRLKSVTPTLFMQALEDVEVKGLKIDKGMTVMMQNKVAQTEEKYFTNPDAFIPKRWLPSGCPMHQAHSPEMLRVFGAGPRFCPGKLLAMQEMSIAISAICKHFDMSLAVDPADVKEYFAFTMYPKNLRIILKPIGE